MNNCIILGFGRSGTSLMGGILYHSGYYLGEDLYPSRESNPKGFFENAFINGINERILSEYDYSKIKSADHLTNYPISPYNPIYGQRWLSYIEPDQPITCEDESILSDIIKALSYNKFAYKDPRFNYTLPVWNRFISGKIIKICMYRHPAITVESVIKDCETADYLLNFHVEREIIYKLWYNNYMRVLNYLRNTVNEEIYFVHYEQLLSMKILQSLSEKLEVNLDSSFISPDLNRSLPMSDAPGYALELYSTLCKLSELPIV